MPVIYSINTSNKFAALSVSDDEGEPVKPQLEEKLKKSEQIIIKNNISDNKSNIKVNSRSEEAIISSQVPVNSIEKDLRGRRRGGSSIYRGSRGGYIDHHGRTFDRRDGSGRGRRIPKHGAGVGNWGTTEDEVKAGTKIDNSMTNFQENEHHSVEDCNNNTGINKVDDSALIVSYEDYMKQLDAKRIGVKQDIYIETNNTQKDFEKEDLKRYVRQYGSTNSNIKKQRSPRNFNKNEKTKLNYFELAAQYGRRATGRRDNHFNRKEKGDTNSNLRTAKVSGRREAPDVTDIRAFPELSNSSS
ncbi:hypothetical protein cand_038560 [Cryptosporidium andersoni]|uniref:Hyaluronan/mRNA-binding protein domain-containing protein n=1 Tax=Cryptosporidium andersoni TaxID=117008 RepID=A0A1J4MXQ0_9CRYT|nr:hypothetical protein cand_038560 [Cryptosporidium andersoni]